VKNTTVYLDATGQPLAPEEQERLRNRQLEDDALRDARQRELADRWMAITRFYEHQLVRRDWISIDDIIDWRSRDRETGVKREDFQIAALRDLDLAIRTGKYFFVGEQSRILLTFPFVDVPAALIEEPLTVPESCWLSRAQWQAQHELAPAQHDDSEPNRLKRLFRTHLQWAWIPRELCLRWSKNVPFEPRPEWFEGMAQGSVAPQGDTGNVKDRSNTKRTTNNARGRPKEYRGDEIKVFALGLVEEFGLPDPNNRKLPRQADLVKAIQNEWAQKRDIHLADSSVRRYVEKWLSQL
jgi:hypothetical protein